MEERGHGIILRTRPLTETSLIVHLLTRDLGRLGLVAKGARRSRSPFAGKLDLFYEADVSFTRSRRSELHNLREIVLRETHPALRTDLTRLNAAAYLSVLLEHATETETPIPEFYDLAREFLVCLDQRPPNAAFIFGVEWKVLHLLGRAQRTQGLSERTRPVLDAFARFPLEAAGQLPLPNPAELELFLRRAVGMALERLPVQRERLLRGLASA